MARLARVMVPGVPHHATQRGDRRERVFFDDDDCGTYLELISAAAKRSGTAVWSYCLMPNHVHFLMVPSEPDGLRKTFAEGAGATPGGSMRGSSGRATCGRGGSAPRPWTSVTRSRRSGTWR